VNIAERKLAMPAHVAFNISSLSLAQGTMPHLDGMYWLLLASRVLHILGAIVLVGGLFYLRMIIAPTVAAGKTPSADAWFGGRRAAWAKWVGIATLILLITGLFNYIEIRNANDLAASYHMMAGIKILVSLVLIFLASLLAGRSSLADQLRGRMKFWLGLCLLIGMLTVALGSVLRSYPHTPKALAGPALVAPSTN
jgi:uncharacterized membrane protein